MGYFDASYLKVRSITLGYTLNSKLSKSIGIQNIRVYGSVMNPFIMFSKYHTLSGLDPETNSYGDQKDTQASVGGYAHNILVVGTNTPSTHDFLFGINVTF
jgi:TonB-dependent starch-binding outer membrane protein SusC